MEDEEAAVAVEEVVRCVKGPGVVQKSIGRLRTINMNHRWPLLALVTRRRRLRDKHAEREKARVVERNQVLLLRMRSEARRVSIRVEWKASAWCLSERICGIYLMR